ncbi:MAG: DUF3240 domain-containing protein [bacterium]|nr:hypothetical protein [Deltaproteobacteria bacterium]MCP4907430.1 DUF3240 domain-containing protein [bacterium]
MSECLLTLITTPEFEERLVDWLLESHHEGFTTSPCRGHGIHAAQLSTAEQVTGVQRRVAFWIQTRDEEAHAIVRRLGEAFDGVGLHYWITPVVEAGTIGREREAQAR